MSVNINLNDVENSTNKQNSLAVDSTNLKYPTVTAVNNGLATKQPTGTYAAGTGTAYGTNTGDETAARIGTIVNGSADYPTPLDADKVGIWDVANSLFKAVTWANIKATLKTYFDTFYAPKGVIIDDSSPTHTGTTAEVIMKLIEIPPLAVGDYFETTFMVKKETQVAQMLNKVRVGSAPTIAGSTIIDNYNTNVRTHLHASRWFVKSDTQIMSLFNRGSGNVSAYPNGGNNEIESSLLESMDRTITNYIMFTSELADATELVTNHFSMVEIKKKQL